MPRLDLDLAAISAARSEAAGLKRTTQTSGRAIADLKAAIARAERNGSDPAQIVQLRGELEQREAEQRSLFGRNRELTARIQALSAGLLAQRDVGAMVQALDGGVPIALLPVRIETRYIGDPVELAIRIYPDPLHVVRHVEGLTTAERERGEAYWRARFERNPSDGEAPEQEVQAEARAAGLWREMLVLYRAPRAAWIVRILTPTNLDLIGAADTPPAFPEDVDDVTSVAKQPYATVLPDRWCAIGLRNGAHVFRVWGEHVPDTLPMGPQLDPNAPLPDGEALKLFSGDNKWLIDFEAARAVGMAIVVRARDLAPGFGFGQGIDRLVVLGVDWTLDPSDSAGAVGSLLRSHQAASEFSFVPLGTPTNNTAGAVSGFDSGQQNQTPPSDAAAVEVGESDAVDLMRHALGLDASAFDTANIPNANLAEQRTALHMINALWYGTFGRYLSLMLNPWFVATDPDAAKNATDSYVPRYVVANLRDFAKRHLRPGGALPAFRIEKQPYGVLPVLAANQPADSAAGAAAATERGVLKVANSLRPRWRLSSQKVPRLIDGDLKTATDLLQTGPWSRVLKARGVDDPMASYYSPVIEGTTQELSIGNQQTMKAEWTAELLGLFGITKKSPRDAMIDNLVVAGIPRDLIGVPWVQADAKDPKRERAPDQMLGAGPDGKSYIQAIRDALGLPDNQAKSTLNAHQSGTSLLEQLLAFSAEEEFDGAAISLVDSVDRVTATKPFGRTLVSQAPPTLVNIEAPLATESWREIRTTRELAAVRLPSVTGRDTIEQHLARGVRAAPSPVGKVSVIGAVDALSEAVLGLPYYLRDLSGLKVSLDYLATRTVGELDTALKTTLDAYSYRLDAWFSAVATRRLEAVRAARPQGLYFGGYGWVEQLPPPSPQPDSLGYVHAPSLAQAATAGILRSGHLANHESAKGTFNIDLSSERVHRALGILEGVTNGQSLAALLGYRFERALRDDLLGEYILDFRRAFPLRPASDNASEEPKEQIAARDVVDGIKLLTQLEAGFASVISAVNVKRTTAEPPLDPIPSARQTRIGEHLAVVAETWDAVSDTLVGEGVYQIAMGNLERAGAALAVLDKQQRPISPQVTQTPRVGVSYAQRLLVVCESDAVEQAWQAANALDPRAGAEPLLNAWLSRMLGDPTRFAFAARVMRGDTIEGTLLRVAPHELGWSTLTLVLASRTVSGPQVGQHSALRARIAQALAVQVADPDANTSLLIEAAGTDGKLGLAEFEALASTLAQLVESARPLTRKDMVVPRDEIEAQLPDEGEYPGADLAEIEARAASAQTALEGYLDGLENAPDAPTLLARLADGWLYGIVEAQPGTRPDAAAEQIAADPAAAELEVRRERAANQARSQLEAARALAPDALDQAGAKHGTRVQNAIDRIKQVYGRNFPVLPRFTLGAYAGEVASTLNAREQLTQSDPFAMLGWLPKLARVREGTDRLSAALGVHDALLGATSPDALKLGQFPFRSDQIWAALPQAWANPDEDPDLPRRQVPRLAWVAHAPDALATIEPQRPLGGLLVDEWQEFVPSAWQTTAVSFHYDAPGSRAPQCVLLAVPPSVGLENWTFDTLLATVNEAFDLAKLRAVRPQDLVDALGLMLPANYLPENPTPDVPSVRLNELLKYGAAKYSGVVALGKA